MHYSAHMSLLDAVGAEVRAQREARGWSRRVLAVQSGVSERFLAQLEAGDGNISLRRFAEVARALGTTPSALLAPGEGPVAPKPIALLGVRGAGKSTIGAALAKRLGVRFVELDREIERAAGLPLGELFSVHGEAYYRRVEHDVLQRVLDERSELFVLAAGGSIVTDDASYALLRARCHTIWLRASADEHWNRVVAQGDRRPMAEHPHAFDELRALLAEREQLYARADRAIRTSGRSVRQVVKSIATIDFGVHRSP
jgi:XRE family aerobic/anaerobic benzoate catabolism transcriptional regulator